MLVIIYLILLSMYITFLIWVLNGNFKKNKTKESYYPFISIVVALRNEESNIERCLKGLSSLIYPEDKIEIILINDGSKDNSEQIIKSIIKDKKCFNYFYLDEKTKKVKGKAGALDFGFSIAKGEIILTTDADCKVQKSWAKDMVKYFDGDVAVVCGITTQQYSSWVDKLQAIDFEILLYLASGTMNNGLLMSAMGNNMAILKKAYKEIGGFSKIKFSLTEDYQLLKEIHSLKKYKLIFPIDKNTLIFSLPIKGIKSIISQKRRWAAGIKELPPKNLLLLGFLYSIHLIPVFALIFNIELFYLYFMKVFFDYLFYRANSLNLGIVKNILSFVLYEVYLNLYLLIVPITFLFEKKITWKGKSYNVTSL